MVRPEDTGGGIVPLWLRLEHPNETPNLLEFILSVDSLLNHVSFNPHKTTVPPGSRGTSVDLEKVEHLHLVQSVSH